MMSNLLDGQEGTNEIAHVEKSSFSFKLSMYPLLAENKHRRCIEIVFCHAEVVLNQGYVLTIIHIPDFQVVS